MFNFKMYKQKKKRAVDPNAPPRPNLLTHEKRLKDQTQATEKLLGIVERQQNQIGNLQRKLENMQTSMEQLIEYIRRNR